MHIVCLFKFVLSFIHCYFFFFFFERKKNNIETNVPKTFASLPNRVYKYSVSCSKMIHVPKISLIWLLLRLKKIDCSRATTLLTAFHETFITDICTAYRTCVINFIAISLKVVCTTNILLQTNVISQSA